MHVLTPTLRFLEGTPRSVWLSLAGGVSVAYVFVHLLPELAEGQRHVAESLRGSGGSPDVGLQEHHERRFRRIGRWLLAASVLLGSGIAVLVEISEAALAVVVAFVAGGVILNVLEEEVPSERQSRFWAFAVGAAVCAALLLAE